MAPPVARRLFGTPSSAVGSDADTDHGADEGDDNDDCSSERTAGSSSFWGSSIEAEPAGDCALHGELLLQLRALSLQLSPGGGYADTPEAERERVRQVCKLASELPRLPNLHFGGNVDGRGSDGIALQLRLASPRAVMLGGPHHRLREGDRYALVVTGRVVGGGGGSCSESGTSTAGSCSDHELEDAHEAAPEHFRRPFECFESPAGAETWLVRMHALQCRELDLSRIPARSADGPLNPLCLPIPSRAGARPHG
mmetsp:Transcript_35337/g.111666  ORF Transcript_35337/g.111666 Transcript_35337/m.111666 type:complete len:254 (-) Transcript_35337:126-887(-)